MASFESIARPGYMFEQSTQKWYPIAGRIATGANYIWSGTNNFKNSVLIEDVLNVTFKFNCFLNPAARSTTIPNPQTGLLTFIQKDAGGTTVNRFEYWTGSAWTPIADPNAATKDGVETLTNKTLTSPTITSPTINAATLSGTLSGGTFTGTTLTSPTINSAVTTVSINPATLTANAYTLQLSDRDKVVELNSASPITLNVPANTTTAFPIGSSLLLLQTNTGQVTVTGLGAAVINGTPGLKLRTQWSAATLIKRATDTWILSGDISA